MKLNFSVHAELTAGALVCERGRFLLSFSLFLFFFHLDGSPPPALIKRALCERGCEEGRRTSHGSDWRAEVEEGCVCFFSVDFYKKEELVFPYMQDMRNLML